MTVKTTTRKAAEVTVEIPELTRLLDKAAEALDNAPEVGKVYDAAHAYLQLSASHEIRLFLARITKGGRP